MDQNLKPEFQYYLDKGLELYNKQKEKERTKKRRIEINKLDPSRFEIIQEKGNNKELDDSERHCAARVWTDKRTCDVVHRADSDEELHRMIEGRD